MQLIQSPNLTMGSREIAELVGSRHDNVKRTIQTLADRGVIQLPQTEEVKNHLGQSVSGYQVCKRDSFVVVAQLSPEFTARLVDRWQELEEMQAAPSFSIPSTLSGALRLAAEQAEQIEQQQVLIKQQQPAVEFVGKYVQADGLKGFREVAKLLGAKEHAFREFLTENRIMYMLGGEWTAYAQHLDAGRFEVKTSTTASGRAVCSSKFTTKGVNWIAGLWAVEAIKKQPLRATR